MIIEYSPNYNEQIKNLLVELQQYLSDIDKEGYNIVGDDYREKYFEKTIEEVKKSNGKILLFKENEKIVGLVVGIVNNDEEISGCEKIMIAVFGYNENAIKFYERNGYHMRMIDMIED